MDKRLGDHAVVIGGSMAGLMTARVLSDFFDEVTVLERDEVADEPAARKSVPQGYHYHALLRGGELMLSSLYPGFVDELESLGAVRVRVARELAFILPDGKAYNPFGTIRDPFDLGFDIFSQSRGAIEHCVRQLTCQVPDIRWQSGVSVKGLVASDGEVRGLEYARNGDRETIEADLIVDAGGRGTRAPRWLADLGFQAPEETEIGVDFAYSSSRFRVPEDLWGEEKIKIVLGLAPDFPDGGIMGRIEDDLWLLSLAGRFGNYPPSDEEGFFAFAESIYDPTIFEMISAGERVADIVHFKFPTSMWRHYEALETFPEGYLVLGDAVASFNPVYGQGMSSAANQVGALQRLLEERASQGGGLEGLAAPFFGEVAGIVESPWALAAGQDLAFPDTVGERPPDFEEQGQYFDAVAQLVAEDDEVNVLFNDVFHLVQPLSALMEEPVKSKVEARLQETEG